MAQVDEPAVQRLAEVWQGWVDSGQIVGGVLLVAQGGVLRYVSARGWADRERRVTVTRDTRFRLASLTKLLTSVAVLQLCEQGI